MSLADGGAGGWMRSRMKPEVRVPVTSVRLQPPDAYQFRDAHIPFQSNLSPVGTGVDGLQPTAKTLPPRKPFGAGPRPVSASWMQVTAAAAPFGRLHVLDVLEIRSSADLLVADPAWIVDARFHYACLFLALGTARSRRAAALSLLRARCCARSRT